MTKYITVLLLPIVLLFPSCKKGDSMPEGAFEVTYLGTANPCTGLQIQFKKKDLSRLKPYLSISEYQGDGRLGTLNLSGDYQAGERIAVRIRQLRDDEHWMCVATYEGLPIVYVLDDEPVR